MKELIQLLQIWKDQGAIKPDGLLKDTDIQILIDKMAAESQGSDSLPCVRLSLLSDEEIKKEAKARAGDRANKTTIKAFEAMGYWVRFMIENHNEA